MRVGKKRRADRLLHIGLPVSFEKRPGGKRVRTFISSISSVSFIYKHVFCKREDGVLLSYLFIRISMFTVLFLLIIGMGIGYVCRKASFLHNIEKTISGTVFLMLFVFGISIGSNDELVKNLDKFGYQAAFLAVLGTVGSLVGAYFAYRFLFKKEGRNDEK